MWGCLKAGLWALGITFLLLLLTVGGGWWYTGSAGFAEYVRKKIETTLEARLGREVSIGSVTFVRSHPQKIILNDLRIANAPGGAAPQFAIVGEVEITGGVQSFWRRAVKVDRVDIRGPRVWFEVLPDGTDNFPKWKTSTPRRFEIVRMDIGRLYITGGTFGFNDRKHEIVARAQNIDSTVTVTQAEGLYEGILNSPLVRLQIQDYEPFDLTLRAGFRYTPGILDLRSVALQGRGIEAFLAGRLDPLTEAAYNFRLTSRLDLQRVKEIFRLENTLEGTIALDTRLRGRAGDFEMAGGWSAPRILADAYALGDAKGQLTITNQNVALKVEEATYGGGTIGADYVLSTFSEPYPMRLDLRYRDIGIEPLFSAWGVDDTGLRGAATGQLRYRWNKDLVLEGAGEGTARLSRSTVAFSDARYPIPLSGTTEFSLDRGVVTFRNAELDTEASHITLAGSLKIEGVVTDLRMDIRSTDFSELDRLGYNFAHSAGKTDYELLGLGGAGTIAGSIRGPIDTPQVEVAISGSGARYNEILLGDAGITLRYNGSSGTLTFAPAVFTDVSGRLTLNGDVVFPESGPGPRFDLALEAAGYPAQRAIDAIGLDLQIGEGLATGRMVIAGHGDEGRATFSDLIIRRADATLALNGTIHWMPGEGNLELDLDVVATDFPVADIASFLDFADLPVAGDLTGTLKIAGRKESLEGSGSVVIRRGTILDEPIDLASADIIFSEGRMRATNVLVQARAGEIRGEAEIDLGGERFSYTITSGGLDASKISALAAVAELFGGRIVLSSTGAGTFDDPELVVEARLEEAALRGLTLPEGSAPPSLYLAVRDGRLVVRGSVADIISIQGDGTVGEEMAIDGLVQITVNDIARAIALSPTTASLPAAGNLVIDLKLGGRLTPIEALIVEATVPVFNLEVAGHQFVAPEPLRLTLRNGRVEFDSFALERDDSRFAVTGFAEITGAQLLDIAIQGRIGAALLQLFTPDLRAEGYMDVALTASGTLTDPAFLGTADLIDAQVRFAGFRQLIDEINGRLRFRSDRIEIESLRATVGGGTVVAGGFVTLDGFAPRAARITLQGSEVALRAYEGLTLEGNFTLLLSGDVERASLTGDVAVTRALYFRDLDIQQLLLDAILSRTRVPSASTATWEDRIDLRVRLTAPETLAIRNNVAEMTGSAALDVTGTLANPVILGEVALDEGGTLRIQGVDYRLVRGTIAFQNPFRIDPYLDITIEGTVSGGGDDTESGPYEVTVNLTGTLDRLSPSITSDPPASDITLFSILGLGGLAGGAGQQAGIGVMGQSLLYQSIGTLIGSKVFPFVDSFSFDPGSLGTGSGPGTKVTFEKRLSNKIRVLVVYNLENQQSRQVVEWIVNRDWTLQLTRDEADEYRLDARFRRRYDAQWSLGSDEEDFATAAVMAGADTGRPVEETPVVPPAPPVTSVDPRAGGDQVIARINFRADARFDTTAVASQVTLAPGEPVTIRELQSSIRNLFGTGNFRDVRVDAAPAPEGIVLTFSIYLHYRVDEIEIVGIPPGERARAQRALTVRNGEVLSLDAVDNSASAIQELLRRYGYLEATVDPETNFDRARSLAGVTLHVTPGPQATVANVLLEGATAPFTPQQLIQEMKRPPGRPFHIGDARDEADRMKSFLVRRGHRRADVDFVEHVYDPASHGVNLHYRVVVGPIVKVQVAGIDRRSVRRWLPFDRNQEYSEDVVDQAADDIVRGLQQRGHYSATVDTESEFDRAANLWTTTFHVDAGPRYRLADVEFDGNLQIPDSDLQAIVQTSPRGGLRSLIGSLLRRPAGVTREQLSEDQETLEAHYRLEGFSQAAADTPVITLNDSAGTLAVAFPITEGPRTIVTEVTREGVDVAHHPKAPDEKLKAGAPLNPQVVQEDVVALQTYYATSGHTEVQVAPRIQLSEDKTRATVTYVIAEGPHVNIDEVVVRGNIYTDADVILRRSNLDPGDPFSYTSLLEAQRDLYRLGIFQRVDVQPQQTGTSLSERNVVIQVQEGKNLTLTGSVGLRLERADQDIASSTGGEDGAPPEEIAGTGGGADIHERLSVAVAHRNLFGTGRYLGLEIVAGREEQEAFLTYREPFISRWDIPVQLQIFQSDDSTRLGTRIQQRGLSIEASKISRLRSRWSLRYEYKISKCDEKSLLCNDIARGIPVADLDRALLDIEISSVTPTFFWDTRDDIIDPRRGFFTSASLEYAFPLFSAESSFLKEYLQGAWYIPVTNRTVVALSGRLGMIQPQGGTNDDFVPLSERFTAGGEVTHRAYALDRLGDLCRTSPENGYQLIAGCEATLYQKTTIGADGQLIRGPILPKGGSGLLLINAEYRFPLFSTVGGAVFVDAGNVYQTDRIDLNNIRYGAGIGFRYLSPVGPIRIDVAHPLNRRWYDDSLQYFVTLGYAF